LRQAGAKAIARSANREAVSFFEQALMALGHLPETRERLEEAIDVRFDLRTALSPLGEFERIFGRLREADGLARALHDDRRLGQTSVYMCTNLYMSGRPREALAFGQNAHALGESLGDLPLRVTGGLYFGAACLGTGDYRRGEERLRTVLQLLDGERRRERLGLAGFPAAVARCYLAWALSYQGRFDEGIVHGEDAIHLAEALEHPYSLAFGCWTLGLVRTARGDLDDAVRLLERGLALSREWSLKHFSVAHSGVLGYAYALSGRVAEGISLLQDALRAMKVMGFGVHQPGSLAYLGEAYALAGRLDDALDLARQALAVAREHGHRGYEAWALCLLGDIAARRDAPEHAERQYREALVLADQLGMSPLVAHCHAGLGRLFERMDQREDSRRHLTTATTMYRGMAMTYWVGRLEAAKAEGEGLAR
jgi:tetratricopeptide (TPR) repeat protein